MDNFSRDEWFVVLDEEMCKNTRESGRSAGGKMKNKLFVYRFKIKRRYVARCWKFYFRLFRIFYYLQN